VAKEKAMQAKDMLLRKKEEEPDPGGEQA
jgi:hypothetical protein